MFGVISCSPFLDAASHMDLMARRASKKEDAFLVGHALPHMSHARCRLILPCTKLSVPTAICSLIPASYLVAIERGGALSYTWGQISRPLSTLSLSSLHQDCVIWQRMYDLGLLLMMDK
jgi:hypothetical protein